MNTIQTGFKYRIRVIATLAFLCLASQAHGQFSTVTLRLEIFPDPLEAPSLEDIDALEAKAQAGDWGLKLQFASAYLYEYLKLEYWNWGCRHLPNGHVCRAMANRINSGHRFLREIVDLNGDGPIDKVTRARLQADFARRLVSDARPQFSPEHPACQEAVRYYERAIENELTDWSSCTPMRMSVMAWHGKCMPVNHEKAAQYAKLARHCAQE
jgi:hypothetical protein